MTPPVDNNPGSGGPLGRVSARSKLAVAIVIITGTALLPRRLDWLYLAPAVILSIAWLFARLPLLRTLRRLLVAEIFILGTAGMTLLVKDAAPLFLAAVVKSNLCILAMLILTGTTPFSEILIVLRQLKIPAVMVTTLALMYRYLPVLGEESRRMQRARASRTFVASRRLAWRNLSQIIGHLFIRSVERAERIYLAMCARGWKG